MSDFQIVEGDRFVEMIDGENLVCVVIAFPIVVSGVEFLVSEAILFERRVGWIARFGRQDVADVFNARVWCSTIEPDALDGRFQEVFAEFVGFFTLDDLLHIWLLHR